MNGIFPKAAVFGTAAVFGLIYSLSATLIALDLMELGMSETFIGANAAMHAVGVLGMAFLLPRVAAFFGMRETMVGSLFLSAALLILFPAMPAVWLWFPLRILLGAASEALFVLSETWLNALSKEEHRAKTMGIYTAALSVGFALGPMVLSLVGSKFEGSDLIGIYAVTGLFWGGGALAGPLITGAVMEVAVHGLAFFAAASCAIFTVMAIVLRKGV